MKIVDLNPKAAYWLFDNKYNYDMLVLMCPDADIIKACCTSTVNEDLYNILEDKDMKFDLIIGNPPYNCGLHIKILKKTLEFLQKDGIIVWLSPIVKWQYARLMEIEAPVTGINVLFRFSMDDAKNLFGINQRCELGILSNKESLIDIVDNHGTLKKIKDKLDLIKSDLLMNHLAKDFGDYPVAFYHGCTLASHGGHGKACYRICNMDKAKATRREKLGHTRYYNAESAEKQDLVWKFYSNQMIRFICKEFGFGGIPFEILPWIKQFKDENGKTPFDCEWSFEKICRYFNLDSNDVAVIENSLKDYMYENELRIIHINNDNVLLKSKQDK